MKRSSRGRIATEKAYKYFKKLEQTTLLEEDYK
jgi:Holliday junction resolvasome RuvABC ATP-dependent DNA helicase subunit